MGDFFIVMKKRRLTLRAVSQESSSEELFDFDFQQAYDYFLSSKKSEGLRDKTLISYGEHFRFFVGWINEFHPDIKKVNEISVPLLRDYMVYMKEDHFNFKTGKAGLATQTINARIRFLKNFYNFLFKEDIVKTTPTENVNFLRADETQFEPLTEEEMKRLFDVLDIKQFPQFRDYCIMNLLYDTGMRINEAINLTTKEIDFKVRRILLPASRSKTRKPRVIPLSNHTVKLLIELINENQMHFENEFVFLNWYGEQLAEDTFRRNLKRYVEKAGIEKQFRCHDFRRQAITEMLASGASLFAVQAIVGHSQINTTRKYVRFDENIIKNQHELYSPVVKMRKKFRR